MQKQHFHLIILIALITLTSIPKVTQATELPKLRSEFSLGLDQQSTYFSYKRGLSESLHLRIGFFTNLEPNFLTYHFNLGTEYRISFSEKAPELLLGIDLVSLNFHATERNLLGGGLVGGFRYDVTERFNITTEIGATGYMNEAEEFRWSWHRKMALLAGWRF